MAPDVPLWCTITVMPWSIGLLTNHLLLPLCDYVVTTLC